MIRRAASLLSSFVARMKRSSSGSVWSAYGIRSAPRQEGEGFEMRRLEYAVVRVDAEVIPNSLPAPPTPTFSPLVNVPASTIPHEQSATIPPAPSALPATPTPRLDSAAVAGLCTAIGVLVLLVCAVLGFCVRRRKRVCVLSGDVEEVESVSGSVGSGEEIVLESKEGMLVEDEEVWEDECGRKGMSLPRRMW